MKKHGAYFIGTSGFHYKHWKGPFYPDKFPNSGVLKFFSERLDTVEINNTFYGVPQPKSVENWGDTVPDGFVFAIKVNRFITHQKKLIDVTKEMNHFLELVSALGKKLGPLLFQFPGNWHVNPDRLGQFAATLPTNFRYTFEFRDPSWFDPRVFEILSRHNCAFCIYDFNFLRAPNQVTADFVYVRLHGPGVRYRGQYGEETLHELARDFAGWASEGRDIYCYFDNDEAGYAVQDALRLRAKISEREERNLKRPRAAQHARPAH